VRVTRAIREYVEAEIYKKYNDAADEIGKEYFAEKEQIEEHIKKIMKKASEEAEAYAANKGFASRYSYRGHCLFSYDGSVMKQDLETTIYSNRRELSEKAKEKAKQVLFDLEMGDTDKAKLKEVLDNITVD
jgi:vacuolar-type H+-ATPase subunit H